MMTTTITMDTAAAVDLALVDMAVVDMDVVDLAVVDMDVVDLAVVEVALFLLLHPFPCPLLAPDLFKSLVVLLSAKKPTELINVD